MGASNLFDVALNAIAANKFSDICSRLCVRKDFSKVATYGVDGYLEEEEKKGLRAALDANGFKEELYEDDEKLTGIVQAIAARCIALR